MNKIFVLCLILTGVCAGYFFGKRDGLHQGAMEMMVCEQNHATGWYVSGTEFNCIF